MRYGFGHVARAAGAAIVSAGFAASVAAQEGAITLELNRVIEAGDTCIVTMVIANGTGVDLGQLGYEIVSFGADGVVRDVLEFDFGVVTTVRPKVLQFTYASRCAELQSLLVNGETRCGSFAPAEEFCLNRLRTSSRVPTIQLR